MNWLFERSLTTQELLRYCYVFYVATVLYIVTVCCITLFIFGLIILHCRSIVKRGGLWNLVGRCIVKKSRRSSNFRLIGPLGPSPQNVAI